jgi:hypothetical protein
MTDLRRQALHLAYFTIAYNVVECVLALVAGSLAGSIALVGFGLDSLVESLSGGVMIYRFARHETLSPAAAGGGIELLRRARCLSPLISGLAWKSF